MKLALLQCNVVAGDVAGNARRILAAARKAGQEGAMLCVTPELALCGPAPRALLFSRDFVTECRKAMYDLAEALKDGPALLVGAPVANAAQGVRQVVNAAVLVQGGACNVVSRKVYQSQYPESDDARYFERGVSCGLITLAGWRLGIVICEDSGEGQSFWKIQHANAHNPLMELVSRGVDGIVHMAASPFALGRQRTRENMLSHVAARHHVHLFSANLVGGNGETVHAGQSVAFDPTGGLLARARAFDDDLLMVDTAEAAGNTAQLCASEEEECWGALVLGTRDFVAKSGASKVLVGLSGGMDSALVAAIAVAALGKDKVQGVLMPSPYTSQESLDFAGELAKNLAIKTDTLPIEPLMQGFAQTLAPVFDATPVPEGDVTLENVQARIRGVLLMTLSNRLGAMVLNCGNKSECGVGYSTLYGDSVGGLAVIGDVSKTLVYRLAKWYNAHGRGKSGRIPEGIITRPPTAELRPGQKDSDSLPEYDVLDPMLEFIMRRGAIARPEEPEGGTALEQDVFGRMRRAEFKRRQSPPCLRVTDWAFGENWHIPLVSRLNIG